MKVTYLYHSGFAIETPTYHLVFDYFRDPKQIVDLQIMPDTTKQVVFVASHRHPDHFSPEIFQFAKSRPDVTFILSNDIRRTLRHREDIPKENIQFLKVGEQFEAPELRIFAFTSTDVGMSVCATCNGLHIFHAGDLNLWHSNDAGLSELKQARGNFMAALRDIANAGFLDFDVAMFPVDSHIETDYAEGARIFVRKFKVRHFIPMHFWDYPEKATIFELYRNPDFGEYHGLTIPGDSIFI